MVKHRQAVVIIHGMGEPRPMETLATFVDATLSFVPETKVDEKSFRRKLFLNVVKFIWQAILFIPRLIIRLVVLCVEMLRLLWLSIVYIFQSVQAFFGKEFPMKVAEKPAGKEPSFWTKPDLISQSFEVRRLRSRNSQASGDFIETDFYEYYWAHHMEGTKISHVTAWASVIVSGAAVIKLRWVLFLFGLIIGIYFIIGYGARWLTFLFFMNGWIWQVPLGVAATLLGTLTWILYRFIVQYLGDVARYLDPDPLNIKMRQTIRAEGVGLLKRLHDSGIYERIIVVGHSLGSMIAYDILRYSWIEYHARNAKNASEYSNFKTLIEKLATYDTDESNYIEPFWVSKSLDDPTLAEIRENQVKVWKAHRLCGNPWLVTDFITLGSPLRYADIFLNSRLSSFANRKISRELLTCLPIKIAGNFSEELDDGEMTILHHAALFAGTRWTNLFFRTDWVGGRLQGMFGKGIKDVALGNPIWPIFPFLHTKYWDKKDSLEKLVEALELDTPTWRDYLKAIRLTETPPPLPPTPPSAVHTHIPVPMPPTPAAPIPVPVPAPTQSPAEPEPTLDFSVRVMTHDDVKQQALRSQKKSY
jgi:hypothetical protein